MRGYLNGSAVLKFKTKGTEIWRLNADTAEAQTMGMDVYMPLGGFMSTATMGSIANGAGARIMDMGVSIARIGCTGMGRETTSAFGAVLPPMVPVASIRLRGGTRSD